MKYLPTLLFNFILVTHVVESVDRKLRRKRKLGGGGNWVRSYGKPSVCTEYFFNNEVAIANSAVFRSSRIDSLSDKTQCFKLPEQFSQLSSTFCNGDTFAIAATPFTDNDNVEQGYYTRSGMRTGYGPLSIGGTPILIGNAFNGLVFADEEGSQLHFAGVDQAGSALLNNSITGGTGLFAGSSGTVTVSDIISTSVEKTTLKVCLF